MGLLKKQLLFFISCILFFISGCRTAEVGLPTYYISEDVDLSFIKNVAVMPFENMTNNKFAGDVVRQLVITEMLASGFVDILVPGDIESVIKKLNIRSASTLTAQEIKQIGKSLKVQALIMGSVMQYDEVRSGNVVSPEVTISLMMADTSSGSIVWSVTKTRGGASFMAKHFGVQSETMSETVLAVVRDALGTLARY